MPSPWIEGKRMRRCCNVLKLQFETNMKWREQTPLKHGLRLHYQSSAIDSCPMQTADKTIGMHSAILNLTYLWIFLNNFGSIFGIYEQLCVWDRLQSEWCVAPEFYLSSMILIDHLEAPGVLTQSFLPWIIYRQYYPLVISDYQIVYSTSVKLHCFSSDWDLTRAYGIRWWSLIAPCNQIKWRIQCYS